MPERLVAALLIRCGCRRRRQAQDYPTRPVKIVVPFPAGGGTDALARFVAKGLEQRLGQPFIIENRGGAGTTLGARRGRARGARRLHHHGRHQLDLCDRARPLQEAGLRSGQGLHADHAVRDGAVRAGRESRRSASTRSRSWSRLRESKPGRARATPPPAIGAVHHIYCELLMTHDRHRHEARALSRRRAGAERRGRRPRADLFRRRRHRSAADHAPASSGRSASPPATRLRRMPEVPTLHEAGVTGYEANTWQMLVGPPRMPAPIVARLNGAARVSCGTPEAQRAFHRRARHAADDQHAAEAAALHRAGSGIAGRASSIKGMASASTTGIEACVERREQRRAAAGMDMTQELTDRAGRAVCDRQGARRGPQMYPDVRFIPRGGRRARADAGRLRRRLERHPAGRRGAGQAGVDAIMVIGTSLTFYRGYEAHERLLEQLRAKTGLPVSTMSEAVVDGLRSGRRQAHRGRDRLCRRW